MAGSAAGRSAARSVALRVRRALASRLRALERERERLKRSPGVEAVHRLRVASRRVREAVDVASPLLGQPRGTRLGRQARGLTRALGKLRERQVDAVHLAALEPHITRAAAAGFDYLSLRAQRRVRREHRRAEHKVERLGLDRFRRRLEAALARSRAAAFTREGAAEVLGLRAAGADARLVLAEEQPSQEHYHDLRIAVKRLRYAVEVLAPETGRVQALLRALKRVQDVLGLDHDMVVLGDWVERERTRLERAGRRALGSSLVQVEKQIEKARDRQRLRAVREVGRWAPRGFTARVEPLCRALRGRASRAGAPAPTGPAGARGRQAPARES